MHVYPPDPDSCALLRAPGTPPPVWRVPRRHAWLVLADGKCAQQHWQTDRALHRGCAADCHRLVWGLWQPPPGGPRHPAKLVLGGLRDRSLLWTPPEISPSEHSSKDRTRCPTDHQPLGTIACIAGLHFHVSGGTDLVRYRCHLAVVLSCLVLSCLSPFACGDSDAAATPLAE